MPSVASENSAIQHTRHHQPASRTRADNVDREPSSPFADLLDSATPANDPPPAPRNARAERNYAARPAENRRKTDNADRRDDSGSPSKAKDSKDTDAADEATASGETAKTAKSGEEATAAPGADESKTSADTDEKAEAASDAELAAALAAMTGETPQPAVVTEAVVAVAVTVAAADAIATDPADAGEAAPSPQTPAIDPLAALQTAEQAAAAGDQAAGDAAKADADGEVKTDAKKAEAKDDAKTPSQAKPDLAADQTVMPQQDAGQDGDADPKGGKTPDHEIRHAQAKPDAEKPEAKPEGHRSADAPAAAKTPATSTQSPVSSLAQANADAAAAAQAATPAVTPAHHQPGALTATQLGAHIQAQLQASADTSAAVPLNGVALEIASQALAGKNRFEIRLDPAELGRIEVKLDIDSDGNATTRVVVERSDTLDLLKRDASQLERALQQAGLKTSDNGLEFSLRQEAFQQNDDQGQSRGAQLVLPDEDTPIHAQRQNYGRLLGMGSGLDIRV